MLCLRVYIASLLFPALVAGQSPSHRASVSVDTWLSRLSGWHIQGTYGRTWEHASIGVGVSWRLAESTVLEPSATNRIANDGAFGVSVTGSLTLIHEGRWRFEFFGLSRFSGGYWTHPELVGGTVIYVRDNAYPIVQLQGGFQMVHHLSGHLHINLGFGAGIITGRIFAYNVDFPRQVMWDRSARLGVTYLLGP